MTGASPWFSISVELTPSRSTRSDCCAHERTMQLNVFWPDVGWYIIIDQFCNIVRELPPPVESASPWLPPPLLTG